MQARTIPALLLSMSILSMSMLFTPTPTLLAEEARLDDSLARGDAAWERRHEGARGIRAAPGPITEAVEAYEEALKRDAKSLEVYWKLLRALQFQGDHTTKDREGRKRVFGRGKEVSEQAFDFLAERVGGRKALDGMTAEEFPNKFTEPEVARIYYWATTNWGQWGQAYGMMAAARQGVGGRIRDYVRVVIALDPEYASAGGYRIHARLHTEAPKIPFITGWIDRSIAVTDSRQAVEIAPVHPYNRLFLAEALLRFDKKKKEEALVILRELVQAEPRPDYLVSDAVAIADARELLAKSEKK